MHTRHTAAVACLTVVALLVGGCAKPPREELQAAENALSRAREVNAPTLAAESYSAAESTLGEGKNMVDAKKYKEAVPVLVEATRLADAARQEALDAKRAAEEAQQALAVDEPPRVAADVRRHNVEWGDCLACLAARRMYYGDASRWQEIHNANRDIVRDPNLIFPGQVLVIP